MKVVIAAAQFSFHMSGVQRHAQNVVRCLLACPETEVVHFVVAPWQRASVEESGLASTPRVVLHAADMKHSLVDRNLWFYSRLPRLVASLQADVLHLAYPVPVQAQAFECRTVVTLHDLYPYEIPENFGFPKVLFNRAILQQCLRSVDGIACVSDATAKRMKQYVPPQVWTRARRIYNCVEPDAASANWCPVPEWGTSPFLLTVAQHRKNKNIPLLVRVLHRLLREEKIDRRMRLLIVGIDGPETQGIRQLVSSLQMDDRVLFLQGISEPQLQWCYRHCEALLAPSETEGFGLPVVEAVLAGCRVACSDIPVFQEIGRGGRCLFVGLGADSEQQFAQAVSRLLRMPVPPAFPLPEFSSKILGAQYIEFYKDLLHPSPDRAAAVRAEELASI